MKKRIALLGLMIWVGSTNMSFAQNVTPTLIQCASLDQADNFFIISLIKNEITHLFKVGSKISMYTDIQNIFEKKLVNSDIYLQARHSSGLVRSYILKQDRRGVNDGRGLTFFELDIHTQKNKEIFRCADYTHLNKAAKGLKTRFPEDIQNVINAIVQVNGY